MSKMRFVLKISLRIFVTMAVFAGEPRVNPRIIESIDADDIEALIPFLYEEKRLCLRWKPHISQKEKDTFLVYASRHNRTHVVNLLLRGGISYMCRGGAPEHMPSRANAFKAQALCEAAANGHTQVVEMLVILGRDITQDSMNQALSEAVQRGRSDVVRWLLTKSPDSSLPQANAKSSLSLIRAVKGGHADIVEMLLTLGPQESRASLYDRAREVLTLAATKGPLKIVEILLTKGTDATRLEDNIENVLVAFSYAVLKGRAPIVEFLLTKEGADDFWASPDRRKDLALEQALVDAAAQGSVRVLHLLFTKVRSELRPVVGEVALMAFYHALNGGCQHAASAIIEYLPDLLSMPVGSLYQPVLLNDFRDKGISLNEECPICRTVLLNILSDWAQAPKACTLSCGHLFHKACIKEWHEQQAQIGEPILCVFCSAPCENMSESIPIRCYAGQAS
jgi:ankyrin repeat protein